MPHRRKSVRKFRPVERLESRRMWAAHVVGSSVVYQTIQAAVDAASTGATIDVDAGAYPEQVVISKRLTLRGAQAGIDARSNLRGGAMETVLNGVLTADGKRTSSFSINANDVTIDGFIVQGNTTIGDVGAGIVIAPSKSGTHILNNIVQNNVAGIFIANSSSANALLIQHNLFRNNNNDGDHSGRAIYTHGGISGGNLTNVTIDANAFIANYGSATTTTGLEAAIALQTLATSAQSNIRITNNFLDQNGKATLFFNVDNALIERNLVTWSRDLNSAALRFEGGNTNVTIRGNTLWSNPGNVVRIDNKGVPGDNFGFVITANNIYNNGLNTATHSAIVVDPGQYDGPLDATNNWWGSTTGPGNAIIANDNNVISSSWALAKFDHPANPSYLGLPWSTDGLIEVENYDHGGEGISFHDNETSNLGQAKYRQPFGVDIQTTTDAGGGYNVGYVKAGEWLQYTIDVAQAGVYNLDVRVAYTSSGGTFHFELDGANLTGAMTVPNTGGVQVWKTITRTGLNLPAGRHVVRLVMDTANSSGSVANFNWFNFKNATPVPPPNAPTNLATAVTSLTSVRLSWADNSSNETGFILERSTAGGAWQIVANLGVGVTNYFDATAAAGTSYGYRVRAVGVGGESANSNETTANTPALEKLVYLSDIAWLSATGGYGPVERDMSNGDQLAGDGSPITLDGLVYAKGLGTHANSDIVYNLAGQYERFLGDVGIDDRQATGGSVVFQLFADGVKIFDSGVMTATSPTRGVDVSLTNVQQLRLRVTDAGDGTAFDHADWAGAALVLAPAPVPTAPATPTGLAASAASVSQINLTWNDVAGETSYKLQRSIDGVNFTQIATTGANVTSYSDASLAAGTTYAYRVIATNAVGDSAASNVASATTQQLPPPPPPSTALPSGWTDGDIGATGGNGSATYTAGVYTVNGAGNGLAATSDALNFAATTLSGNGSITVRVASHTSSAGIMLREGSATNAQFVALVVNPSGSVSFLRRTSVGGQVLTTTTGTFSGAVYLRLVRSNKTFTASTSTNGTTWSTIGSDMVNKMNTSLSAGMLTFSKTTNLAAATFDNVSVR